MRCGTAGQWDESRFVNEHGSRSMCAQGILLIEGMYYLGIYIYSRGNSSFEY
jgi:hypothetical protein